MSKYNIHAGHNYHVIGANGYLSETQEARRIKDKVKAILIKEGHTVYDCTDEDGLTEKQNLVNIVKKCNANKVDLDISIHLNAFNGQAHGVEVFVYDNSTDEVANRICENISKLGYANRGIKNGKDLYVLNQTVSKAILIEAFFCDNKEDTMRYDVNKIAVAIVEGILNKKIAYDVNSLNSSDVTIKLDELYRVRKTWDDVKSQLGAYKNLDNAKNNCPYGYKVFDNTGKVIYKPNNTISPLKGMDKETFIDYIGKIAKTDMKETGILASVVIAQAILESNWGQSELAINANNLFGMKAYLSGNSWTSAWEGSIYSKYSDEEYNGITKPVLSEFRSYDSPEDSIIDHNDYLIGASNGSELRYKGLIGEKDYKKAAQIIKDGGYATNSDYVNRLVRIIEENNLTVYDNASSPSELEGIRDDVGSIKDTLISLFDLIKNL